MADTAQGDALLAACEAGDAAEVERLLGAGAEAHFQRDSDGMSGAMLAARGGHEAVLGELFIVSGVRKATAGSR